MDRLNPQDGPAAAGSGRPTRAPGVTPSYGTPEPVWVPGDPLWAHPWSQDGSDQAVRQMAEILDEDVARARSIAQQVARYCSSCEVGWRDYEAPCWMCGQASKTPPIEHAEACTNCGNDDPVEGQKWCLDCLEEALEEDRTCTG